MGKENTKQDLFAQFQYWDQHGEFSKIIQAIEAMPKKDRSLPYTLQLAMACRCKAVFGDHFSNISQDDEPNVDKSLLDHALDLLEEVREQGQNDPEWFRCMAEVLWVQKGRLEEALEYAKRWQELAPNSKQADVLVRTIQDVLYNEPEVYSEADLNAVEQHIEHYFGKSDRILAEIDSPDIHLDIAVIPPSDRRNYYTLVTIGMGAHSMNVPEELDLLDMDRAELVMCLPPNWRLDNQSLKEGGRWYWPIWMLKTSARLPIREDTWLCRGHTVSTADYEPYAKNTRLCGGVVTEPLDVDDDGWFCPLPSGGDVMFYQLVPLYKDELEFIASHGADPLIRRLSREDYIVNPARPHIVTADATSGIRVIRPDEDFPFHVTLHLSVPYKQQRGRRELEDSLNGFRQEIGLGIVVKTPLPSPASETDLQDIEMMLESGSEECLASVETIIRYLRVSQGSCLRYVDEAGVACEKIVGR